MVKAEASKIVFPVIVFEYDIDWDFQVFLTPKDLILESIYGHWGGFTFKESIGQQAAIDCEGNVYRIATI